MGPKPAQKPPLQSFHQKTSYLPHFKLKFNYFCYWNHFWTHYTVIRCRFGRNTFFSGTPCIFGNICRNICVFMATLLAIFLAMCVAIFLSTKMVMMKMRRMMALTKFSSPLPHQFLPWDMQFVPKKIPEHLKRNGSNLLWQYVFKEIFFQKFKIILRNRWL